MSSIWSDDAPTVAYPTRRSIELEIDAVFRNLQFERSTSQTVLIAVVRPESSDDLGGICDSAPWNRWKFWRGKPLVIVTTPENLRNTLRRIRRNKNYLNMTVVVSGAIGEISLRVHSGIRVLKVVHADFDDADCSDYLFVNGASTLAGVRLDEWGTVTKESHKGLLKKHAVLLGKHVKIRVNPGNHPAWAKSASNVSEPDQEKLRRHFDTVKNYSKGGVTWKDCRAAVSTIAGIAVGTTKLVVGLKGMAGGIAFQLQTPLWGVKFAAFGLKASAVASVAGPAVLLGAATAVGVYIIPWESWWDWLKGFVARVWEWTVDLWGRFCSLVRKIFIGDAKGEPGYVRTRARRANMQMA
ncbi:hypothetical protein C7999DRAFT_35889 [Corynascus novoguineensis]|uniref:Uncharacterized protein n=1 Tax=Corynascus novoguineensis TaxID=1126955 RepID=A0AAN7HFV4_9PEZI|nr:hypothetical protein C7999DRAFT_35889 [Corynascus novoguineensis]